MRIRRISMIVKIRIKITTSNDEATNGATNEQRTSNERATNGARNGARNVQVCANLRISVRCFAGISRTLVCRHISHTYVFLFLGCMYVMWAAYAYLLADIWLGMLPACGCGAHRLWTGVSVGWLRVYVSCIWNVDVAVCARVVCGLYMCLNVMHMPACCIHAYAEA